ncbi:hypothetical protein BDQ17DRAFT_1376958 [Cyathus striatus]|nr:hypothetical protein BDQ17DRAFT_1376958 [Cyathus striatus]
MPRDKAKTIRLLESTRTIVDLIAQLTNVVPSIPHPLSTASSVTIKILEIALTVVRNKGDIRELAQSCHQVTRMIIDRAGASPPDSTLQEHVAELNEFLNEILSMVNKFESRSKLIAVLAANNDKEEITRAQRRTQHMLGVFSAAWAVEIQQGVVETQQNVLEVHQRTGELQQHVVRIEQTVVETRDLIIVSTLDTAAVRDRKKAKETELQSASRRALTISYQTPAGVGPEVAFAGVSAFFF